MYMYHHFIMYCGLCTEAMQIVSYMWYYIPVIAIVDMYLCKCCAQVT